LPEPDAAIQDNRKNYISKKGFPFIRPGEEESARGVDGVREQLHQAHQTGHQIRLLSAAVEKPLSNVIDNEVCHQHMNYRHNNLGLYDGMYAKKTAPYRVVHGV